MELATNIDLDTCLTIGITALIATAIRIELQAPIEGFFMLWLWAMAMAVLLRKMFDHV
jgi:hypothetical protein